MAIRLAAIIATLGLLAGCAHAGKTAPAAPHPDTAAHAGQCVPLGQWLDIASQETLPVKHALARLSKQQVVLLGEDHDNIQHHRWQLHTLIQLYALQPKLALGFEAFPRRVQPIIDQWLAGQLSERAFLEAVDWTRIWSYDAEYYLPMLRFARMHGLPVYALNVERELISQISAKGWQAIPKAQREGLGDPAPASPGYIEELKQIFTQHMPGAHAGHGQQEPSNETEHIHQAQAFQRFLQSQLAWDRAMAEAAKQALDDGAPLVVGIVGAGHLMGGYGIPHQLAAMGVERVQSLLPWDGAIDCRYLQPGLADLAFGMRPPEPAPKHDHPRLGIYLEPAANGVKVQKVVTGSIAEQLGVQAGDVIVNMAGAPVSRVEHVIERVRATAFGTWLPFAIERQGRQLELVAKFPSRPASGK